MLSAENFRAIGKFDEELQLKPYITEYADGICTTFYHKAMNKGIVTFAAQIMQTITKTLTKHCIL